MGWVRDSFLAAIALGLIAAACGGADDPEDTTPATRDYHDFDVGAGSGVALADDGGVQLSAGAPIEGGESEGQEEDRHVPQVPLPPPAEEPQPPPQVQSPPNEESQAPKKPQLPPD